MTPFQELVRGRRSIRKFLPDPVSREDVLTCLEAARRAPSAHNIQPWRFVIVDDPALKERLGEAAFAGIYRTSRFSLRAPVIIVMLASLDSVAGRLGGIVRRTPFHFLDIGIAGEHIALQATELGLGTCWIGWFSGRGARKALRVPRRYRVVAMMPVGRAEKRPSRERPLKDLREIVWVNGFGGGHALGGPAEPGGGGTAA